MENPGLSETTGGCFSTYKENIIHSLFLHPKIDSILCYCCQCNCLQINLFWGENGCLKLKLDAATHRIDPHPALT